MQSNEHIHGKMEAQEIERKRKELFKVYYDVFSTQQGKTVLEDLKKRFHSTHPIFDKESERNTTFMLGERNVILFLDFIMEQAKN